jgi:methionine sulfoxide reductase heme-binding subunit
MNMSDTQFSKLIVFFNSLVPLALMSWDAYNRKLGANPIEFVIHTTGTLTLIFLLLSLSVTPLRRVSGRHSIIKFRRMLGLLALFYGSLHLLSYSFFDKSFNFPKIIQDVFNRQFIAVGMISFLMMVPLAITSTNSMIRRLGGKRWIKLHKSIYYISAGGLLHYWMSVKADTDKPLIFGCILGALLGYRLFYSYMRKPAVETLNLSK